jgi:uridine kinase
MSLVKYVIGISGGSGSGKTSIVQEIRKLFTEEQLCIVSQDNYYIPREEQIVDEQGVRNFDLPTSIDLDGFIADVLKLKSGDTVTLQEYIFNNELKESKTIVYTPAPVIMVEGLFVYHNEQMRDLLDYKFFVDAPEDTKLIRRIRRDRVERNYPLEDVLYRFENHVTPSYVQYILPYKSTCDMIINNRNSYDKGIDIVSSFIKSKLMD